MKYRIILIALFFLTNHTNAAAIEDIPLKGKLIGKNLSGKYTLVAQEDYHAIKKGTPFWCNSDVGDRRLFEESWIISFTKPKLAGLIVTYALSTSSSK